MKKMNSLSRRFGLSLITLAFAAGVMSPAADAAFEITSFTGSMTDPGGARVTQAGAHPDFTTGFQLATKTVDGFLVPDEDLKDVKVDLPAGLSFNPQVVSVCSAADFYNRETVNDSDCPADSQVGTAAIAFGAGNVEPFAAERIPIYNITPSRGEPARLGYKILGSMILIRPQLRTGGDYGLTAEVQGISQGLPVFSSKVTLWGVPADSVHDPLRARNAGVSLEYGQPSRLVPKPLVSLPTSCSGSPLVTQLTASSWQQPERELHASFSSDAGGFPFLIEGCDKLGFTPSVSFQPTSSQPGAPTGLDVDISSPQSLENPQGLAAAQLRDVSVTLPKGMTINPASADGLEACSDQQLGLNNANQPSCPEAAKIGTVSVETPVLADPLDGNLYIRSQASNDPESGEMLRVAMVISSPERGVLVKLAGSVKANKVDGQLTASFDENPQLPVEAIHLSIKPGPRAPLLNPTNCGVQTVLTQMSSWAGHERALSSSFNLACNGAGGGFSPALSAGTVDPIAGKASPFTLRVTRQDGEQNISRIDATLPEGLLAKLAGVPLCGDAAAATGACPASSQVGTTSVGVGAGSNPLYVPLAGKAPTAVYLAGPYQGAPYSLVVKVPAQAGPFDLGTVAVRSAIDLDPVTARASVKSDPLPQILQGIPIAYRDVRVDIDRPDFTLNPTSCTPMAVESTIYSAEGRTASPSSHFQVAGCERLGFAPKLALSLSGPTHRSAFPALKAVLTARKGDANIASAQVTLPKTEILEQAHIKTICTRVQYAANNCPKQSIYGYAKAWSPLLDQPLQGPVYLRSSSHKLPDLVASLDGQIHIDLAGHIDSVDARIRNTFEMVPDAPVSKFVLTMQGGKKGLLVNNTELCKAKPVADALFEGQNGKTSDSKPVVKADCGKGRKRK